MNAPSCPQFDALHSLDWTDLVEVGARTHTVLEELTGHGGRLLLDLLERLPAQRDLLGLCERLPFMDKLVLWQAAGSAVRLRAHVFRPGYADWPHNHRFTFTSRIVHGCYLHRVFAESVLESQDEPSCWQPLAVRHERPGDEYVMHHEAVHSLTVLDTTVSLVLRGPIVKPSAVLVNGSTGERGSLLGSDREPARLRAEKQMDAATVAEVATEIRSAVGTAPEHRRSVA